MAIIPVGQNAEDGFYDSRDDMCGGTDNPWTPNWASAGDNAPVIDYGKHTESVIPSITDLGS